MSSTSVCRPGRCCNELDCPAVEVRYHRRDARDAGVTEPLEIDSLIRHRPLRRGLSCTSLSARRSAITMGPPYPWVGHVRGSAILMGPRDRHPQYVSFVERTLLHRSADRLGYVCNARSEVGGGDDRGRSVRRLGERLPRGERGSRVLQLQHLNVYIVPERASRIFKLPTRMWAWLDGQPPRRLPIAECCTLRTRP